MITTFEHEILHCMRVHLTMEDTNVTIIGFHPDVVANAIRNDGDDVNPVISCTSLFLQDMTLQDAVDDRLQAAHNEWTLITDGFDIWQFEETDQYLFLFEVIKRILEKSEKGIIFKLPSDTIPEYNIAFVSTYLFTNYPQYQTMVKGNCDGSYIFCITK